MLRIVVVLGRGTTAQSWGCASSAWIPAFLKAYCRYSLAQLSPFDRQIPDQQESPLC